MKEELNQNKKKNWNLKCCKDWMTLYPTERSCNDEILVSPKPSGLGSKLVDLI